jgi:hypothetical protein
MKNIKIFYLTLTLCCTVLFGCRHDPELQPFTPAICFESTIVPIIANNCSNSGCHDGSSEVFSLITHQEIQDKVVAFKPLKSSLYKAITSNPHFGNFMPPKGSDPITSAQISQIEIWILQGAIDDPICAPQLNCFDSIVPNTFSARILLINNFYCTKCHSEPKPAGGILLTNYDNIKQAVENNNYQASIHQTGRYPMPKSNPILKQCFLDDIDKWIKAGTPNN